eukprot:s2971_g2.t1
MHQLGGTDRPGKLKVLPFSMNGNVLLSDRRLRRGISSLGRSLRAGSAPVSSRHWLTWSLLRHCGGSKHLVLNVSSCFAIWRMLLETTPKAQALQLLRVARALGAFDLSILRVHPELTFTGLVADQVRLLDLGAVLQHCLMQEQAKVPRALDAAAFPSRLGRYTELLRRLAFRSWRATARAPPKRAWAEVHRSAFIELGC